MLSITTDYARSTGSPNQDLKDIAEAGFTHIHWCHQWNTDFIYSQCEIDQIKKWLTEYNLLLCDLHASDGQEKKWDSNKEYERLAGIELVKNRIDMTAQLGSDVIIMHADEYSDPLKKSLDELEIYARDHNVRIAIENGKFSILEKIFSDYSPKYIGLCYDCGHGNMINNYEGMDNLDRLDTFKDRLISIHLHDNDGVRDQHKPLFSGTIDWDKLARVIAHSSYKKCVSMELSIKNSGITDEKILIDNAFKEGTKFSEMIAQYE
jgi:sugar phosphate isomerase/epimerase